MAAAEPVGPAGLGEAALLAPGGILALGLVTCSSLAGCSLRGTNFTLPDRSTLQIVFVLK